VLRLRQKLEAEPGNPQLIRSVRGFGYSFNDLKTPPESAQQAS
jgi:DNA-binding response OmpR family regulator